MRVKEIINAAVRKVSCKVRSTVAYCLVFCIVYSTIMWRGMCRNNAYTLLRVLLKKCCVAKEANADNKTFPLNASLMCERRLHLRTIAAYHYHTVGIAFTPAFYDCNKARLQFYHPWMSEQLMHRKGRSCNAMRNMRYVLLGISCTFSSFSFFTCILFNYIERMQEVDFRESELFPKASRSIFKTTLNVKFNYSHWQ